jgi:hypothetical protein
MDQASSMSLHNSHLLDQIDLVAFVSYQTHQQHQKPIPHHYLYLASPHPHRFNDKKIPANHQ